MKLPVGNPCRPKIDCDPCRQRGFTVAAVTLGCGSGYYCQLCADIRERCRSCDRPLEELLPEEKESRWTQAADRKDDEGE